MKSVFEKPTKADQKVARLAMDELEKILENKVAYHFSIQSGGKKEQVEIPTNLNHLFQFLLGTIATGKAVQISTVDPELSTQEAADMLGVSRPFLVKLLEQGQIPFKKVGKHRRIELKDLETYARKQKAITEKNLTFLIKQAQDLNLGYEQ